MDEPMPTSKKSQAGPLTQWGPLVLILGVLAFYVYGSRSVEEPPGWGHDYQAALVEAKASGRNVLLAFHSPGCPPCAAMDRTVLRSEAVRDAMASFVPVRIDAWESPDVSKRYQVFATPTYVIARPDGTPMSAAHGFLSEEEFVSFLNRPS